MAKRIFLKNAGFFLATSIFLCLIFGCSSSDDDSNGLSNINFSGTTNGNITYTTEFTSSTTIDQSNFVSEWVYSATDSDTSITVKWTDYTADPEKSAVEIDDQAIDIFESTENQLIFSVPDDLAAGFYTINISIEVEEDMIISDDFIVKVYPDITTISYETNYDSSSDNISATIIGKWFDAEISNNEVFINGTMVTILSADRDQIKISATGSAGKFREISSVEIIVNNVSRVFGAVTSTI